jgi:DnaJ family protein C protein 13
MFDTCQENPELIWNGECKDEVANHLNKMSDDLYDQASRNPNTVWKLPDDFELVVKSGNEILVAGVYLRLFVENPGWVLRRPKEFLTELFDFTQSLMDAPQVDVSCV